MTLVVHFLGGSRQDALRWLADFASMPLQDKPLSREERQDWARERRELERYLTDAGYWRRAAVNLAEDATNSRRRCSIPPSPAQPIPSDQVTQLFNKCASEHWRRFGSLLVIMFGHKACPRMGPPKASGVEEGCLESSTGVGIRAHLLTLVAGNLTDDSH